MAVESGSVDVLMFPVSLYQHDADPERETLLRCCVEHQVGVVAMKPYYGGALLSSEGHTLHEELPRYGKSLRRPSYRSAGRVLGAKEACDG